MKITDLTCPQCSGLLNQEGDKFFCSSCGAAFGIDYDEDDVEYQRLITEADRTRALIAKDRELLETDYRLRKEYEEKERQLTSKYRAKNTANMAISTLIIYIVSLVLVGGFAISIMIFLIVKPLTRSETNRMAEYEAQCEARDLTEDQILNDKHFLETMEAVAIKEWDPFIGEITEDYKQNRDVVTISEPQAVKLYFLRDDKEYPVRPFTRIYLVLKATYQYTDTDKIKDSYYCVSFQNPEMTPAGVIELDLSTACIEPAGSANGLHGYSELDQLYREKIKNRDVDEIREVDLTEAMKED